MLPGRITLCAASPRASWASATVGTAWAFVHCTRSCVVRARLMMPLAAMAPATTTKIRPTTRSRLSLGVLKGCEDIVRSDLVRLGLDVQPPPLLACDYGRGRG